MSQTVRMCRLKACLDTGRCFSSAQLMASLEVSRATLKRDIEFLRSQLNWPVVFDRHEGGYRLDRNAQLVGTQFELPGLRLSADDIYALLTMQHLLENLDTGGLLGPHVAPLTKRLTKLLEAGNRSGEALTRRIKVHTVGARPVHLPHFQAVGAALLHRQRLLIGYHARTTNEASEREVSPQRLIHYRNNWYLDAWCHLRNGLRRFSMDIISRVQTTVTPALDVPEEELDAVLGSGYGIFSGTQVQWAELRFTPERARWVAAETLHPKQEGHFEADGSYVLRLPYTDPRELAMDVMRHVPDVEVLAPEALREDVAARLRAGVEKMGGGLTP